MCSPTIPWAAGLWFYFLPGLNEIKAEIDADQHEIPINELWNCVNGRVEYLSLCEAIPLDSISPKFDVLFREFSTTLAHNMWNSHMKAASDVASQEARGLTIMDIKTSIWEPTFKECLTLLDSLHSRSIKLTDVDRHFLNIKEREKEIRCLHDGVTKCLGPQKSMSLEWIKTAVKLMDEYWSLLNLADAAKILLTLKDSLSLSGDFSLIQAIADEVSECFVSWSSPCNMFGQQLLML
jgi:hypothetical protein